MDKFQQLNKDLNNLRVKDIDVPDYYDMSLWLNHSITKIFLESVAFLKLKSERNLLRNLDLAGYEKEKGFVMAYEEILELVDTWKGRTDEEAET